MILYQAPGLIGLELWRGISRGKSLFELRDRKPEYFHALRDFVTRLHAGDAVAGDDRETAALVQAAGFARVVFSGGDALHPLLASILRRDPLPFEIEIDGAGLFAARRGALRIFHEMHWRNGLALDLGQLQLKVIGESDAWCIPRDVSRLPFGPHALDPEVGQAGLRTLLQDGVSRAALEPDGVVLGLPVAIDTAGVAEPATYPGLFGAIEPIFAPLFTCPWILVNDAVLTAVGFPPRPREKTLVVTLGFGIGGALWQG